MTNGTAPATKWPDPVKAGARRSILAADLVVNGDVASTGPVDVQGRVTGQVKAPEIQIAPTGTIDGTALAHHLSVQGHISGAIEAQTVSLSASSIIQADVMHERIAIEAGARIEGQLKRPTR